MKTEALLIQSAYGDNIVIGSGLNIWYVNYDGTIQGFMDSLRVLQDTCEMVKYYKSRSLNPNNGGWLLFSVIHRETVK